MVDEHLVHHCQALCEHQCLIGEQHILAVGQVFREGEPGASDELGAVQLVPRPAHEGGEQVSAHGAPAVEGGGWGQLALLERPKGVREGARCIVHFLHVANGDIGVAVCGCTVQGLDHGGVEHVVAIEKHEVWRAHLPHAAVARGARSNAGG